MAASPKNWRDKVWLAWFAVQVLVILREFPSVKAESRSHVCVTSQANYAIRLVVDGVPFLYPARLYEPKGSPLHFLQQLRDYDLKTFNDPLIQEHSK